MTFNTQESRVNVLLRLVGMVFFVLGATLSYLTYSESVQGNLVPQIAPVFYLVGGLLIVTGLVAVAAKYK